MKRWVFRIILIAALAALGIAGWFYFFPRPEQVIRRRLTEMAQLASFGPKEGELAKLANSQKLTSYFAENVEIILDVPGQGRQSFSNREELLRAAMGARSMLTSLGVSFPDIAVRVTPTKTSALVEVTIRVVMPTDREPIIQEMKLFLKKIGGDWLIERAETVRPLSLGGRDRGRTCKDFSIGS
jgi:hypothetical protein